jgi:hypothetical protein
MGKADGKGEHSKVKRVNIARCCHLGAAQMSDALLGCQILEGLTAEHADGAPWRFRDVLQPLARAGQQGLHRVHDRARQPLTRASQQGPHRVRRRGAGPRGGAPFGELIPREAREHATGPLFELPLHKVEAEN